MASRRKWRAEDFECQRCGKNVENMTRIQQDEHEKECIKQKKLDGEPV